MYCCIEWLFSFSFLFFLFCCCTSTVCSKRNSNNMQFQTLKTRGSTPDHEASWRNTNFEKQFKSFLLRISDPFSKKLCRITHKQQQQQQKGRKTGTHTHKTYSCFVFRYAWYIYSLIRCLVPFSLKVHLLLIMKGGFSVNVPFMVHKKKYFPYIHSKRKRKK